MLCKPIFSALTPLVMLPLMAACSPSQPAPEPKADTGTAPAPAPLAPATPQPASQPTPTTDSNAPPKPGATKTFTDWTVGCDNGLRCTLGSLLPEASMGQDTITLNLTREPGPVANGGGKISLAIETRNDQAATKRPPASFAVDGKPIALRDGGALAAAIANAQSLKILDAKGGTLSTLSLKGAAAALRYIDAQQGRAGSTDAIVAKGPAASRAPTPALPVIAAVAPSGAAARLTAAQIATMRKRGSCDLGNSPSGAAPEMFAPEIHALGGGKSLAILPCSTGAYNLIGILFIIDGAKIVPAQTDAPSGFEETGADPGTRVKSVVNGTFENGVLTSYAKGRGLGDCGVMQSFVWDGTRLRLSEQSEMGECRGNIDYVTTWRTTVVRQKSAL
ncbi:DUF1176 domain-containing protein [Sphingomonas sp. UV9]|uniref:DUF1176 domain-containing protein n=1 Tax=Sphingomonas sp. UV9 TaxID=1851410 RepID=UPI000FFBA7CC|nr:DUF1176 domain-containing protein [Sphingomonas sp. UV9]RXD04926.1 DUF1176 domain-containing protein [Sphingomonas sp. UV9]